MEPVASKDHRRASLPAPTSFCATSCGATTRSGCTSTWRFQGADRAVKVSDGLRAYLPELLAWSASSPFVENVNTASTRRARRSSTRFFPRCGVPDAYGDWDTFADYVEMLYATGSIGDPTEMWWSVRPHLGFPTVEIRISDAQPLREESIALAALSYSLAVRIARAVDEGEPLLRRRTARSRRTSGARSAGALRRFIDLRTHEVRPARTAVEELLEWVQPVAVELGTAEYLNVPDANAAGANRPLRGGRVARGDLRGAGSSFDGAGEWLRRRSPRRS